MERAIGYALPPAVVLGFHVLGAIHRRRDAWMMVRGIRSDSGQIATRWRRSASVDGRSRSA